MFSAIYVLGFGLATAWALEPPTREQLERYRQDGSLERRTAAARALGNHRVAPQLVERIAHGPSAMDKDSVRAAKNLRSTGRQNVLALLLSFSDAPGFTDPTVVHSQFFGDGLAHEYPGESLRNFYRRSSHGLLEIAGSTLGWYQTNYPRSAVPQTDEGREGLIREALEHYDAEGHDFSQYDNDGDGIVDYLIVIWTGNRQGWADFWWGYQTYYQDDSLVLDGVGFSVYSWQWESDTYPGPFSPAVAIHETGHALGLPDYYDYDHDAGPDGGVGDLDRMDGNWGDHNCFSKWLLGWLTPEVHNSGSHAVSLRAADLEADAVVLMHGDAQTDPYGEYFMVEHRRRQGNDSTYPADGLLIWHVDARQSSYGHFLYDNSYTEHKLLRLMEADGLETIESGGFADAGDFYQPGDVFGNDTLPSSKRYDGSPTNLLIEDISADGEIMGLASDLGSGCALFCNANAANTAWPGIATDFSGSTLGENCDGEAAPRWIFGDGGEAAGSTLTHSYAAEGSYSWQMSSSLGDASCIAGGEILACRDFRCWRWDEQAPMNALRARHGAVRLRDGRVLVVGSGRRAEIYDPISRSWHETAELATEFGDVRAVHLQDDRVLVVGYTDEEGLDSSVYDPSEDSWQKVAPLNHRRSNHSALALADGRVLVAGGYLVSDSWELSDVLELEIFDPGTSTWTVVGELPEGMTYPGLNQLADGRVFISANRNGFLFDPVSLSWGEAQSLLLNRSSHFSVLLDGRTVLIGGGHDSRYSILHTPADGGWRLTSPMNELRANATATVLASGRVLVVGGISERGYLASAEVYDPATESWTPVSSPEAARIHHTATELWDGSVLVTGGFTENGGIVSPTGSAERLSKPQFPPMRANGRMEPSTS